LFLSSFILTGVVSKKSNLIFNLSLHFQVLRAGNSQYRLNVAAAAAAVENHAVPDRHKEELLQQLEALNTKVKAFKIS